MNIKVGKKTIFWWIMQIAPPLIILPLSTMPMDIGTGIFWLAGIIACFISLFSIGRKVFTHLRNKNKQSTLVDIIRPSLTIFFMILALSSVRFSLHKAENVAFETAKYVQKKCDSDNICPDYIPTWNRIDGSFTCESLVGGLAKYRVLYGVSKDKKIFTIMLRLNMDSHLYFYGGVGKEIQRDYKD
jgi:hypothetical protein